MSCQHATEDGYLDYIHHKMSAEEEEHFLEHLKECQQCQAELRDYEEIILELPLLPTEMDLSADGANQVLPWRIDEGKANLLSAARKDAQGRVGTTNILDPLASGARPQHLLPSAHLRAIGLVAATALLSLSFSGLTYYYLGVRHAGRQAEAIEQSDRDKRLLQEQIDRMAAEKTATEARLNDREGAIAASRRSIDQQRSQVETLTAALASEQQKRGEGESEATAQREVLERTAQSLQASLTKSREQLDNLESTARADALHSASLENQIHRMSRLLEEKDETIKQEQELLAKDRDIRDLIGARNLLVAEMSGIGPDGKPTQPYGRMFYTKNQKLVFYGYDLDEGLKQAGTFQAWGQRKADGRDLKLDVMYMDDSKDKRWVLHFDDPQVLDQLNAIFITIEPNDQSRSPHGKQVLFAYLREKPNHP